MEHITNNKILSRVHNRRNVQTNDDAWHTSRSCQHSVTSNGALISKRFIFTDNESLIVLQVEHVLKNSSCSFDLTPVARLNWLRYKVSDFPNSFSEFFFSNSVLLCSFLWAVEWIHESPSFSFFKQRKEKPPKRPGAVIEWWRYQCNFPVPSWAPT